MTGWDAVTVAGTAPPFRERGWTAPDCRVRYFGAWRDAWVERVTGREAVVRFSTPSREWTRRVSPHRNGAALVGEWRDRAARTWIGFGFPELVDRIRDGASPTFADPNFEVQALANACDLALMDRGIEARVDRGDVPPPDVGPWRTEPWRPPEEWDGEGDP